MSGVCTCRAFELAVLHPDCSIKSTAKGGPIWWVPQADGTWAIPAVRFCPFCGRATNDLDAPTRAELDAILRAARPLVTTTDAIARFGPPAFDIEHGPVEEDAADASYQGLRHVGFDVGRGIDFHVVAREDGTIVERSIGYNSAARPDERSTHGPAHLGKILRTCGEGGVLTLSGRWWMPFGFCLVCGESLNLQWHRKQVRRLLKATPIERTERWRPVLPDDVRSRIPVADCYQVWSSDDPAIELIEVDENRCPAFRSADVES